jgi:hypothetical protein
MFQLGRMRSQAWRMRRRVRNSLCLHTLLRHDFVCESPGKNMFFALMFFSFSETFLVRSFFTGSIFGNAALSPFLQGQNQEGLLSGR